VDARQRRGAIGLLDFEQAAIAYIEGPEHFLLQCVSQRREGALVKEPALCEIAYRDGIWSIKLGAPYELTGMAR
jgi:hypothetical protein